VGPTGAASTPSGSACPPGEVAPEPGDPSVTSGSLGVTTRLVNVSRRGADVPDRVRRARYRGLGHSFGPGVSVRHPFTGRFPRGAPGRAGRTPRSGDRGPVHQAVGRRAERDDRPDVPHVVLGEPVRPQLLLVLDGHGHRVDGEPGRRRPPPGPRGRPGSTPGVSLSISASCSATKARAATAGRRSPGCSRRGCRRGRAHRTRSGPAGRRAPRPCARSGPHSPTARSGRR
jgi:hypothetical protein